LNAVGERAHEKIAAEVRRLDPEQTPPLGAELGEAELLKGRNLIRYRPR
jgi:hypothetical protein